MSETPDRDIDVFTNAVQLHADQRAEYLARACEGNEELRKKVEALLHTHDHVGDFLEESPQDVVVEPRPEFITGEKAGDRIGRYKLLQQIGEGGCGIVFMAEQKEPFNRRVAIKIIKPGMDSKSVIARFEAERQALALMDHPNIAKVFDAGTTESGRPYFVMELIRGVRITEYCDQHSLTTEERLKLLVPVCQAIQHAHQKGIIHRDIKPSNVLVSMTLQGEAIPMVIDFGIAKATTNQRLTDKTLFTAFEMLIGTPAYMSPEQAALSSIDVDTRTDIYSLGVLLYELLTGLTPFDTHELLKAGLDEIRRVIREQEPQRPSTRLSKMTKEDLTATARHRKSEAPTLIRLISGDLDWIAMKALEKDRTRRYQTALGMALDIQHYLANEPISARPPSRFYKFQKLVLRNKFLFVGLGMIILLLVSGLIALSASFAKERQARHDADAALQQSEADKIKTNEALQQAETDKLKAQQVTQFLEKMLNGVGPSVAQGQDTTMLKGILDRTAKSVGEEMTNQPAVEAELRTLIGQVYYELGNYDQAEQMQRAALAINQKLFGEESLEAAASFNELGLVFAMQGKLAAWEDVQRKALHIRRRVLGNINPEIAASLSNLAEACTQQGKYVEAEALVREALEIRQQCFGGESLEVADSLRSLGILLGDEGKWGESEAMLREVLATRRKRLGPKDPLVATTLCDVAWAAGGNGKLAEAESMERAALTMRQTVLGEEHPDVAKSLYLVGDRLRQEGKLNEALSYLNEALSMQRKLLRADNIVLLDTQRSLGLTFEAEGKFPEAEKMHRAALIVWDKLGEDNIPQALSELECLSGVLMAQKKFGDAEVLLDEKLTPPIVMQPSSADLVILKAGLEARRGEWQEAAADFSHAFDLQPNNDDRYCLLAALLIKTSNYSAYEKLRQRILSIFSGTTNIFIADQVAKASLFLPPPAADLPVLSHLADITVTLGANNEGAMPFFEVCKALSEYRQGHFAEAAEWAEKTVKCPRADAQGFAYAVLAMADWQRGEKTEARDMLAKGETLEPLVMPQNVAKDSGDAWCGWLYDRIPLDEACALIQSGQTNVK
jgi:serine/threonine protein kinase